MTEFDYCLFTDGDQEDGEADEHVKFDGRDGIIYLIDAAKSVTGDRETFDLCLSCMEQDMLKIVWENPRNLVSVVFYNTKESPAPNMKFLEDGNIPSDIPSNCALYFPLQPLNRDFIQHFKDFRSSGTFFDFRTKYGSSTGSNLKEAFRYCSRLFTRSDFPLMYKRIFLFTNNEQPYISGTPEYQQALVQANDLASNKISIELVPLQDQFDTDLFYLEPGDYYFEAPKEQQRVMLERQLNDRRKRMRRHFDFEFPGGTKMAVDLYRLSRTPAKPKAVYMRRDNNETIATTLKGAKKFDDTAKNGNEGGTAEHVNVGGTLAAESGPGDNDVEMADSNGSNGPVNFQYQTICGKDILFTRSEVNQMKNFTEPGIRLLGQKPISTFKRRWMVKEMHHLYPNEKKITGSTTMFIAFWRACLKKQIYALCELTMTKISGPRYVALLPVREQDKEGADGFRVIFLPMENHVSHLPQFDIPAPQPTEAMVTVMEKICKKLRCNFDPSCFENPTLGYFITKLEALAYNEMASEYEDTSKPDIEKQDERIGELASQFMELFGQEHGTKRANDGEVSGSVPKRSQKEFTSDEIEQAVRNGRIDAVTVAHLKEFIKSKRGHVPSGAVKKGLFDIAKNLID